MRGKHELAGNLIGDPQRSESISVELSESDLRLALDWSGENPRPPLPSSPCLCLPWHLTLPTPPPTGSFRQLFIHELSP